MATMELLPALLKLQTLQASLALTTASGDPVDETIRETHLLLPDEDYTPICPAWKNTWEMSGFTFVGSLREQIYDVRMQLMIEDGSLAQASEIATAFWAKLLKALHTGNNLWLDGTISHHEIGSARLAMIQQGRAYPGIDAHLAVYLKDTGV